MSLDKDNGLGSGFLADDDDKVSSPTVLLFFHAWARLGETSPVGLPPR